MTDRFYCLNLSSASRKLNYVYIKPLPAPIHDMLVGSFNKRSQLSWNYASFLCQYVGGFLPQIRSKSELNEFIALITFSQYVPPQDKVFIGL